MDVTNQAVSGQENERVSLGSRASGLSETAGLASGHLGAERLNVQGNIDLAEASGNAGMESIVASYANNPTASLAGFMAEQEYVRSFNIRVAEMGYSSSEVYAIRGDSHAVNSPDISTSWGETYQPKFYESPEGTARALTEIVTGPDGPVNRYAGQQLLAPADQLEQVRLVTQGKIDGALAAGDMQSVDLLQDSFSRLTDRITSPEGITSDAFGYGQMQEYAAVAQTGGSVDMGDGTNIFDSSALMGEAAALAAGVSAGIGVSEIMLSASGDLLSGKITAAEMSGRVQQWWEKAGKATTIEAGGRSVLAGGLASMEAMDPAGAVVVATLAWDLAKLGQRAARGELQEGEVTQTFKRIACYKLPVIGVSAASISAFGGPAGIALVVTGQLMARELIRQHGVQQACIGFLSDIHEEMEKSSRMLVGQAVTTERALAIAESRGKSVKRTLKSCEATLQFAASRNETAKKMRDEGSWSGILDVLEQIGQGKQK